MAPNCSTFSGTQLEYLSGVRSLIALVFSAVCLVFLVLHCCKSKGCREYKHRQHRFVLYLIIFTLVYLGLFVAQLDTFVRFIKNDDESTHHVSCKWIGFLDQLASWLQLLCGLLMELYWLIYYFKWDVKLHECCKCKCACEIFLLLAIAGISFSFSIVPVFSSTPYEYGLSGGWCWIQNRQESCEDDSGQWILWYGWLTLFIVITFAIFLVGIYATYNNVCRMEHVKAAVCASHVLFHFFILLYLVVGGFEFVVRFAPVLRHSFGFWMFYAVVGPITGLLLPLIFFLAIHFGKKKDGYVEIDQSTVNPA